MHKHASNEPVRSASQRPIPRFSELKKMGRTSVNNMPIRWVKEVSAADLSPKTFFREHLDTGVPVLIRGAANEWPALGMTDTDLMAACQFRAGKMRRQRRGSKQWGSLEDIDRNENIHSWNLTNFFDYMYLRDTWLRERVTAAEAGGGDEMGGVDADADADAVSIAREDALDPAASLYMADIDLCFTCASFAEATSALPFFGTSHGEMLSLHENGTAFPLPPVPTDAANPLRSSSSSCGSVDLFSYIGGQGTGTGLHQDNNGVDFWMAATSGTKEMVLFPPSDAPYLVRDSERPKVDTQCTSDHYCGAITTLVQMLDFFVLDPTTHPQHASASAHLVEMRPGDVLYASGLWWHQARNVEARTIGVTGNFHGPSFKAFHRHMRSICGSTRTPAKTDWDTAAGRKACLRHIMHNDEHVTKLAALTVGEWDALVDLPNFPSKARSWGSKTATRHGTNCTCGSPLQISSHLVAQTHEKR